jgi:drug/metabolite transporter (DMT)-like permease
MQWSDISFTPSPRTLRQFAGLWLIFFGMFACVQGFVRHNSVAAVVLAVLAVAVAVPGLVNPRLMRPVYVAATVLTFPIGWIVSKIILACMFFLVFTPVGIVFRLIGRDLLKLRRQPAAATHWIPKDISSDPRSYFRPF